MLGKHFSLNGKLLPANKATIPIDNIEFTYGFGVYENLKVRNRILYFPELHSERLLNSANIISLRTKLNKKIIQRNLKIFAKSVNQESFNIKMMLIGNRLESDLYIFATAPKYLPKKAYTQGIKVITYYGDRQFPQAKTLSMLMSYLAYTKAKEKNAYDALMINRDGIVREGTRSNFFYTDGKKIFTSPKKYVLNGVTRLTLLKALKQEGIKTIEKDLNIDEISKYDGFFLTNTSSKVLPILEINNKKMSIPNIIKSAVEIYDNYLKTMKEKYKFWKV